MNSLQSILGEPEAPYNVINEGQSGKDLGTSA